MTPHPHFPVMSAFHFPSFRKCLLSAAHAGHCATGRSPSSKKLSLGGEDMQGGGGSWGDSGGTVCWAVMGEFPITLEG